ncbi:MAG: hypothetical protein JNG84_10320, partial [Archangium sp.]|nr:hypothetical protein [Archangium sp.]
RGRGDYFFDGSFKTEAGAWLPTTEYLRARKNICQDWANEPLRSNGLRAVYELSHPYFIKMYREAKFRQLDAMAKLPNFKKPSSSS